MGQPVSVGNRAGKPVYSFTAAGQDSGVLSLKEAARSQKWMFQLTGTGTGYQVTLYGTIDQATGYNEPGNNAEWFELPSPSVESGFAWANPLMIAPGRRACYVNAPLVAVRAVSDNAPGATASGTVELQAFVMLG